tara:strand:+ start:1082 stop:1768 length:687 start_codon:yes stop_codon:yes gene_type:complete
MAKTATSTFLIGLVAWLVLAPADAQVRPPAFAPAAEAAQPLLVSDRDHRGDRDRRHGRDRNWRMGDGRDRHDGRGDDRRRHWSGNDRHDGRKDWTRKDWDRKDWTRKDRDRRDWGHRGADRHQWGIRRSDRNDPRDRDGRNHSNDRPGRDLYRRHDRPADTYTGGGGVWRDPGNGTYVYSGDGGIGGSNMKILEVPTRRGPKVIGIAPDSFEAACDYAGDVCIIRPGR